MADFLELSTALERIINRPRIENVQHVNRHTWSGSAFPPDLPSALNNISISSTIPYTTKINSFRMLNDNWDGYGGYSPSENIILTAKCFVETISNRVIHNIENIYPNPNGTIKIDLEKGQNIISIEIGEKNSTFFAEINDSYYSGETEGNPALSSELNYLFERFSISRG